MGTTGSRKLRFESAESGASSDGESILPSIVEDHEDSDSESELPITPNCCDYLRARRVWCGLRCFGCVPDPLRAFQVIGLDCTRFYGRCGRRSLCAALLLAAFCWVYLVGKLHQYGGLGPVFSVVPWALVLGALGIYLLALVCATRAGVELMMNAIGRTEDDPQRPLRVQVAYESIGNLEKDLEALDYNSAFAVRQLIKDHDTVIGDAIQRGFDTTFFEQMRGDDESQRFLLASCILSAKDPQQLNERLRVYADDSGTTVVCEAGKVPASKERTKLDEMLRHSGLKEEIALSVALLPKARARAVLLRWAMGRSYEANVGFNLTWIKQGVGKTLNPVDELSVARLLLVPPLEERRETIRCYDEMTGGPGSFRKHLQKQRMSSDFRVALLCLLEDNAGTCDVKATKQSLDIALRGGNRGKLVEVLCTASEDALQALTEDQKGKIRFMFHMSTGPSQMNIVASTAHLGPEVALPPPPPLRLPATRTPPTAACHTPPPPPAPPRVRFNPDSFVSGNFGVGSGVSAPPAGFGSAISTHSARSTRSVRSSASQVSSGGRMLVQPGPGGRLPYWLAALLNPKTLVGHSCGPQAAEQFEVVIDAGQQAAEQGYEAAFEAGEALLLAVNGPPSGALIELLLCAGDANVDPSIVGHLSEELGKLEDMPRLSSRFQLEFRNCIRDWDLMGLVGLLVDLDPKQRERLLAEFEAEHHTSLAEEICRHNWHLMEVVLLGLLMPSQWMWARTLYEACCGGITGLGTDEETLTSVVILNWHQREKLSAALQQVCKWKGHETTVEKLIEEEIENVNFKRILLNFLVP